MPTKYQQEDGTIVYVTHIPDWKQNSEGSFCTSYQMARAMEQAYERRTGERVDADAYFAELVRRRDREGWRAAIDWNRELLHVLMVEDLRWADAKEKAYQRDVLKWPEDVISGERFWRELREGQVISDEEVKRETRSRRTPFTPELKDQIWLKSNGHCAYCGLPLLPFTNFTIDHIVPFSDGGPDIYDNLVACCKSCNSRKHAMPVETFRQRCGGGLFWIEKNGGAL